MAMAVRTSDENVLSSPSFVFVCNDSAVSRQDNFYFSGKLHMSTHCHRSAITTSLLYNIYIHHHTIFNTIASILWYCVLFLCFPYIPFSTSTTNNNIENLTKNVNDLPLGFRAWWPPFYVLHRVL